MERSQRIKQLLLDFVALKTYTGTSAEQNNRLFYEQWWSEVPYFQNHPDHCGSYAIPNDPLDRSVCWAFLEGEMKETVILIHHTDTVDVLDYGPYGKVARDPLKLADLYKQGVLPLPDDAKADLLSDEWLFGRGVSDMKSGAAMQCALLEEYAIDPTFKGSVLLLGVPDEENMSAGMRGAIPLITSLQKQYDLHYRLLINSEPHERERDDEAVIYDGSVGKVMPIVLARGQLSHVSEVYQGLNAAELLAAVVRQTEIDPWFVETKHETTIPGATWLSMRDRKVNYDVSLPLLAGGYLSVLQLTHTPTAIMEHLKSSAEMAFHEVLMDRAKRYKTYREKANSPMPLLAAKPLVLTYQELCQAVIQQDPSETTQIQQMEETLSEQVKQGTVAFDEANFQLMEYTLSLWLQKDPVIVIGLMAPYYPAVSNDDLLGSEWITTALEELEQTVMRPQGEQLAVKHYFTGISDMSYAMFTADPKEVSAVEQNLLFFGGAYDIPFKEIEQLNVPVLNIGAWGKDLHRYTERVNIPDLLEQAPKRLDTLIQWGIHSHHQ
ncbi:MAG: M20/M25/M40 family metallo-hydrolase [Aerococcus sp.]|nr:M20/M25/M40 family metallo-hydrolase [Aerococcus sp.]